MIRTSSLRWKSSAGPPGSDRRVSGRAMQVRADLGHFIIDRAPGGHSRSTLPREAIGARRAVRATALPARRMRRTPSASAAAQRSPRRETEQTRDVRRRSGPRRTPARNSPTARSCVLPRELAPADVAAVEAVGEIDLVDRAIGARPGVGEAVRRPPLRRGPGRPWRRAVPSPSAVPAWKTVTPSTCSAASISRISAAARRRAGIAARGDDDRHRMLRRRASAVRFRRAARSRLRAAARRNRRRSAA